MDRVHGVTVCRAPIKLRERVNQDENRSGGLVEGVARSQSPRPEAPFPWEPMMIAVSSMRRVFL